MAVRGGEIDGGDSGGFGLSKYEGWNSAGWWLEIGLEGSGGGIMLSSESMLLRRGDHLSLDILSKTTRGWRREVRESGWL